MCHSKDWPPMSESGHSRHFDGLPMTSGLPLETDIVRASRHVSKVPIRDLAGMQHGSLRQRR
jgi:hypothetical protein